MPGQIIRFESFCSGGGKVKATGIMQVIREKNLLITLYNSESLCDTTQEEEKSFETTKAPAVFTLHPC
jgi:hypothetical protein